MKQLFDPLLPKRDDDARFSTNSFLLWLHADGEHWRCVCCCPVVLVGHAYRAWLMAQWGLCAAQLDSWHLTTLSDLFSVTSKSIE